MVDRLTEGTEKGARKDPPTRPRPTTPPPSQIRARKIPTTVVHGINLHRLSRQDMSHEEADLAAKWVDWAFEEIKDLMDQVDTAYDRIEHLEGERDEFKDQFLAKTQHHLEECARVKNLQEICTQQSTALEKKETALGYHLHTQQCVDYSVKTAMAGSGFHCIADCATSHRNAMGETSAEPESPAEPEPEDRPKTHAEWEAEFREILTKALKRIAQGRAGDVGAAVVAIEELIQRKIVRHVAAFHMPETLNEVRKAAGISPVPVDYAPDEQTALDKASTMDSSGRLQEQIRQFYLLPNLVQKLIMEILARPADRAHLKNMDVYVVLRRDEDHVVATWNKVHGFHQTQKSFKFECLDLMGEALGVGKAANDV